MGFNLPNERDMRQMRDAANIHEQLRSFDRQRDLYNIQDLLTERRSVKQDLRAVDAVRYLREVDELRRTLGASQLDFQRTAQEALDQHERIRGALGADALEMVASLAEQQAVVSLQSERVALITEQLDVNYLTRTLRRAQEMLSDSTLNDVLAQADTFAIIREAEAAMDAALSEPGEFTEEFAGGPPEWMRHLSRENLVALVTLLSLLIETLGAAYGVSLILPGENAIEEIVSDAEVQAVVAVLIVSLRWARYLLDNYKDG
jgi:hypothetical protein